MQMVKRWLKREWLRNRCIYAEKSKNAKGKLSDDPSTPDVNEAWEGGKAPKKRKQK